VRRRYVVRGEVQGVGFRYYTVRLAERIGIRGWVRNLSNGNVEAVGEGNEKELLDFESGLRRGPAMANVTELQIEEIVDQGSVLKSFHIR